MPFFACTSSTLTSIADDELVTLALHTSTIAREQSVAVSFVPSG